MGLLSSLNDLLTGLIDPASPRRPSKPYCREVVIPEAEYKQMISWIQRAQDFFWVYNKPDRLQPRLPLATDCMMVRLMQNCPVTKNMEPQLREMRAWLECLMEDRNVPDVHRIEAREHHSMMFGGEDPDAFDMKLIEEAYQEQEEMDKLQQKKARKMR